MTLVDDTEKAELGNKLTDGREMVGVGQKLLIHEAGSMPMFVSILGVHPREWDNKMYYSVCVEGHGFSRHFAKYSFAGHHVTIAPSTRRRP